jgi:hypothetical protein
MTITSQQVDAWDAAVDAAYEAGRQEGMKQERALWELSKLGQEIEAQPEEPVSWGVDWSKDGDIPCAIIIKRLPDGGIEVVAMEYGPPQRPWVGLTDEERDECDWGQSERDYAKAIEAKLKEKNT